MKLKYLFLSIAALTLLVAGCKPKEELGPEEVTLSGSSTLELATAGQEVTVTLKSTVDWTLQGYDSDVQSWLVISPSSGKASNDAQTITIKALENKKTDRSANIVFYGNILCKAPLTITQKGPDGDGSTLSIADFIKKADTSTAYTLSGKVLNYKTTTSNENTYYSFDLLDDSGSILVYSFVNMEEWMNKIEVGGTLTLKGKYEYYSSKKQHEVVDASIVSFTAPDYSKVQEVSVTEFLALKDTKNIYKLTGTVTGVNTNYCSFNLSDGTSSVYVYCLCPSSRGTYCAALSNGDTVTLYGNYYYFENTSDSSKSKPEILGAYISSHEKGSSGDDDDDDDGEKVAKPTKATKVTIKEFLEKPVNTTDWYEITGTITSIAKETFGNFYVKDETDQVYVYGMTKEWADGENDQSFSQIGLKAGDEVTFWTLRSEYNETPQAGGSDCPALYISHKAGSETTYPAGSVVLTFPDDNKDNNAVNDYVSSWTAKIGSNEFSIENFNNYEWNGWTYIKCGRKKNESVAKIANATAVEAQIAKIVLTADSYDASSINSLAVNVYSDSEFKNKVCTVNAPEDAQAGAIEFAVPAANQAKGLFYEIVFDCKVSSATRNGFVQISKVAYVASE